MSESTASTNESMIWCAKTGELQSLKSLLKEVILLKEKRIAISKNCLIHSSSLL